LRPLWRSRADAEHAPFRVIGDDVQKSIRAFLHVANPLAELAEVALLTRHDAIGDDEADERLRRESAHQDIALPSLEDVTAVERHARWRDDGIPVIHWLLHARLLDPLANLPPVVVLAVSDHGPAIVFARLWMIQLVAAGRAVLHRP
jgi:hypothetical protein